jgi:hypothetical protein
MNMSEKDNVNIIASWNVDDGFMESISAMKSNVTVHFSENYNY